MAAYAALISLKNTITMEQRPRYHPRRRISIDDAGLIEALLERVASLVDFLEASGWKGVEKDLDGRIADAAYAAEDAIDTYMMDQVQSGGTGSGNKESALLCQDLREITQDMDSLAIDTHMVNQVQSGGKGPGNKGSALLCQDVREITQDMDYMATDTHVVDQVLSGGTCTSNKGSALLRQALRKVIQDMDLILNDSRSAAGSSSGSSPPAQGNRGEIKYLHLAESSTSAGSIGAAAPHRKQSQMMEFEIEDQGKDGGISRCAGSSSSAPPHGNKAEIKYLYRAGSSRSAGSSSSAPAHDKTSTMVGFEYERTQVVDELISGGSNLKVIALVGMGGAGKTTLLKSIFEDQCITPHFDVHAWVSISQEYNVQEILLRLISYINGNANNKLEDKALELEVYQSLFGRKYFVVLDDIWSIDVWHEIKKTFPDDLCGGSRIVMTTRDENVAIQASTSYIHMKHLDENKSWKLLCEKVFGETGTCPPEFEDVGKRIAQNCRGLPLAIVVIGGILAMYTEIGLWKHVLKQSHRAVRLDERDECLGILSLSYDYLDVHLKPCFLYMGIFPEGHEISVSRLINLWIAEGFLKLVVGKTLKETAMEYIKALIARNLIMVHQRDSSGEIEYCSIHDLLRELTWEKALEEKFLCVVTLHRHLDLASIVRQRRIAILLNTTKIEECPQKIIKSLLTTINPRSLIGDNYEELSKVLGNHNFKLLRVFFVVGGYHKSNAIDHECLSKVLFNLVNLRYLSCEDDDKFWNMLVSSLGLLGNLQVLAIKNRHSTEAPSEIWNLPQLCHVEFDKISLPDPPFGTGQHDYIVLQKLLTLQRLINFRFKDGVLAKIPNIKSMNICYDANFLENMEWSQYSFHNIGCLENLESFDCSFEDSAPDRKELLQSLAFPTSLKKLKLSGCGLHWEDMIVISSIPYLEVLELEHGAFLGPEWNVSGEFLRLKYLCMKHNSGLINWNNVESSHFPLLECLVLCHFPKLKEIPSEIGSIGPLRLIKLACCSDSAVISARNILIEQLELGNELLLTVKLCGDNKLSRSDLAGANLLVQTEYKKCNSEDVEEKTAEEIAEREGKNVSSTETSSRPASQSSKRKISDVESAAQDLSEHNLMFQVQKMNVGR